MDKAEKKTPLRMCIACREMKDKRGLTRIVKTPDGEIFLDPTGKKDGRGAYICNSEACIQKCIKARMIQRAFSLKAGEDTAERILKELIDAGKQSAGDAGVRGKGE